VTASPSAAHSTPRIVVFTDLDDTLFQSRRKVPVELAATARVVSPSQRANESLMTTAQSAWFDWLSTALVVPVTARSGASFDRVTLGFSGPAVLAMGAVVRRAPGIVDGVWCERMRSELVGFQSALVEARDAALDAARRGAIALRAWIVEESGVGGAYLCVKTDRPEDADRLEEIGSIVEAALGPEAAHWRTHRNGVNFAALPPPVSKAAAVRHLMEAMRRDGRIVALGLGDSATDLEFMRLCDFWATPTGAQIDALVARTGHRAAPEDPVRKKGIRS